MGVTSKIFGMAGVSLPYCKETENRIMNGLNISQEILEEKYWNSLFEYFYKEGLTPNNFKDFHKGTYRYISDGMSGEYIRIGLVLFENDADNNENIDFYEIPEIDKTRIKNMLKIKFGLDVNEEEITLFVFTHYS